ncbi:Uncharacterised protein [Pseudomonas fluorescens]|uniref:Lipoprotein n=1 Tax=Pseudomonas fluorescens TaxID=294 RepID=A0A3S4PGU6_PSEFL|nr:hypothetical protein [Pseudomonas fluorescens]VEF11504.1 Uncharacterised protein [Pseudomonas fluorescens]
MKKICACLGICSVLMLQGCFQDSDDASNKEKDTSKSSVQLQQDKSQ